MDDAAIRVGINGRFFAGNWRPALTEIAFAQQHGFAALQFRGDPAGLGEQHLGAPLETIAAALAAANITAVMELLIRVDERGLTDTGATPLEFFLANLPAIRTLPCRCVHMHLVPSTLMTTAQLRALETLMLPQFSTAVEHCQQYGIRFGFEHNEPKIGLFATPERCQAALDAVPDLGFVWDINHTIPEYFAGFQALFERVSMVHVSDTRLPVVNEHLPLGLGKIDLKHYCDALRAAGFRGQMILEIGGLPQSGGYGRDTDQALIESGQRLRAALATDHETQ